MSSTIELCPHVLHIDGNFALTLDCTTGELSAPDAPLLVEVATSERTHVCIRRADRGPPAQTLPRICLRHCGAFVLDMANLRLTGELSPPRAKFDMRLTNATVTNMPTLAEQLTVVYRASCRLRLRPDAHQAVSLLKHDSGAPSDHELILDTEEAQVDMPLIFQISAEAALRVAHSLLHRAASGGGGDTDFFHARFGAGAGAAELEDQRDAVRIASDPMGVLRRRLEHKRDALLRLRSVKGCLSQWQRTRALGEHMASDALCARAAQAVGHVASEALASQVAATLSADDAPIALARATCCICHEQDTAYRVCATCPDGNVCSSCVDDFILKHNYTACPLCRASIGGAAPPLTPPPGGVALVGAAGATTATGAATTTATSPRR